MKKYLILVTGFIIIYGMLEILSRIVVNNIILIHAVFISVVVILAAFLIEKFFFKEIFPDIFKKLGFVFPSVKGLTASIIISIVLFIFYPVIGKLTKYEITLTTSMISLQAGSFLIHGITEELVFRGFLYRHLREYGLSYVKACSVSIIFFAAAHVPIIIEQGAIVGFTAFALAAASTFPFAYLFERSGNSILPPAIVHFAIDTIIPMLMIVPATSDSQMFPVYWMILSMIIPYLAFVMLKGFKN